MITEFEGVSTAKGMIVAIPLRMFLYGPTPEEELASLKRMEDAGREAVAKYRARYNAVFFRELNIAWKRNHQRGLRMRSRQS